MDRSSYMEHMSYEFLKNMRIHHPAWKLLAADSAPLVISFLYFAFVADNKREIPEHILLRELDGYMEEMEYTASEKPPVPIDLLTQWADDNHGWLRKFYPANSDEVH